MFVQNNLKGRLLLVLAIFVGLLIYQYWQFKPADPINIAISRERTTQDNKYSTWLLSGGQQVRFVDLSTIPFSALEITLDSCDALLLTGGEDIYPGRYGRESDTARCGSFNVKRDSLEFAALNFALKKKMPVMGICRGLQLINVGLGGTLSIDLPLDRGSEDLHRSGEDGWTRHLVTTVPNSAFFGFFDADTLTIASNHHQGIDRLADLLSPLAYSEDGLIEAIGWKDAKDRGYLLAVQWHPEWASLSGRDTKPLARNLIRQARNFRQKASH